MWRFLMSILGAGCGGALGLYGPVALLVAFGLGSGSYEDVLFIWLASVPLGTAALAYAGYRLGRRLDERARG